MLAIGQRLSYRSLQRLLVLVIGIHNAEEALTAPTYLSRVRDYLAAFPRLAEHAGAVSLGRLYLALLVVTIGPAMIVGWATTGRQSSRKRMVLAVLVAALFWNVFLPHLPAAVMSRGYAPGVATAVGINLPFAIYFFRRSARERMLTRRQITAALLAGLLALVAAPLLLLA